MPRALALVLIAGVAAPASAAPITFDSRAQFRAAAGPLQREGFEACDAVSQVFTGPLDAAADIGACRPGDIRAGVSLVDDPGPDGLAMFLAAPGYSGNRTMAVGQNFPASDALNISFTTPVRAAGLTIFQNLGGGAQSSRVERYQIAVYSADGLIGEYEALAAPNRGGFFGTVSDEIAITRLTINNPLFSDVVDDILFTAAIPAPPALALLALGLGVLAGRRRG